MYNYTVDFNPNILQITEYLFFYHTSFLTIISINRTKKSNKKKSMEKRSINLEQREYFIVFILVGFFSFY
jgi:hypothetical protein